MTTIAYHHKSKTIAWDSRTTSGNVIASDESQKRVEVNGVIFWLSGSVADERLLIDMYFGEKSEVVPEANALAWDGDDLFLVGVNDEALLWKQLVRYDKTLGSGGDFALSAMRLGLSAKEAVEHAKTLDCYTGGEVHVMELDKQTYSDKFKNALHQGCANAHVAEHDIHHKDYKKPADWIRFMFNRP